MLSLLGSLWKSLCLTQSGKNIRHKCNALPISLVRIILMVIFFCEIVPSKNEGDDEESDTEEAGEAEEDESDLDLAWKMLDLARAISEKHSGETKDMVDILSALAEVSLERGIFF